MKVNLNSIIHALQEGKDIGLIVTSDENEFKRKAMAYFNVLQNYELEHFLEAKRNVFKNTTGKGFPTANEFRSEVVKVQQQWISSNKVKALPTRGGITFNEWLERPSGWESCSRILLGWSTPLLQDRLQKLKKRKSEIDNAENLPLEETDDDIFNKMYAKLPLLVKEIDYIHLVLKERGTNCT